MLNMFRSSVEKLVGFRVNLHPSAVVHTALPDTGLLNEHGDSLFALGWLYLLLQFPLAGKSTQDDFIVGFISDSITSISDQTEAVNFLQIKKFFSFNFPF